MSSGGRRLFADPAKLSFDYVPDRMPHREAQLQRLHHLFRQVQEAPVSQHVFLHGSVGTGKTHISRRFCLDLRQEARAAGKPIDHVLVNCRQRMTMDNVLLAILRHFDERFPERGFSVPEKIHTLRRHLEKGKLHLILILDEVDALLKKAGSDPIYTFTRFDEEQGTKGTLSLILISQRRDALDLLDAASLSTFRKTNVVEFDRYAREELRDIVADRVALAFVPGAVQDQSLDLIADLAAQQGDARLAIELLSTAGTLAEERHARDVGPEHVRGAKATTWKEWVEEKLAALDDTQRLVLLGIARAARDRTYVTTGEAEKAYAVACEEHGTQARGHTQFWKYLKELDALGIVSARPSGHGRTGKTTLISVAEIPARTLEEQLEAMLRR